MILTATDERWTGSGGTLQYAICSANLRFLDAVQRRAYSYAVDATYRSDLRELNELNFARFDAKLEQRVAEFDAKLERRIAELRAEMREGFAHVDQRFAEFETKLTNRLFAFWVAQAATTAGLVFGVVKLVTG